MERKEKSFSAITRFFSTDQESGIDYRQISSFFYDQLVDAFIFFNTKEPVDWNSIPSLSGKIKALSSRFIICEINNALLLQCGKDSKAVIGMTLGSFFGKQFMENTEAWKNLLNDGEVFTEFIIEKNEDSILWIEASYRLIKNTDGNTTGIIGVQHDVSRRKIALRAHDETEERLQKLAHFSFQAIAILQEGKVVDLNEAMVKLTGYSRDEIMNSKVLRSCFTGQFAKLLFKKKWDETISTFETTLTKKDRTGLAVEIETQEVTYHNETSLCYWYC